MRVTPRKPARTFGQGEIRRQRTYIILRLTRAGAWATMATVLACSSLFKRGGPGDQSCEKCLPFFLWSA